ncbi:MAG TPA: alkaline phosphatase PhoX [Phenylobacterium sp.]
MTLSRRHLLSAAATATAFTGFARYARADMAPAEVEADVYVNEVAGYGPLVTDPFGLFDLPADFSYTIVSRAGEPMSDGLVTPYKMDGMGCFGLDADRVMLVRNHELKPVDADYGPLGVGQGLADKLDRRLIYDRIQDDRALCGGTTTMVYDLRKRRLETCHLSLAGTSTNCAGGITPWGSWLSCEEIVQSPGPQTNGLGTMKSHGWVFEVPPAYRGVVEPVPITGMGRFKHEAACIDPRTGVAYLTEDEVDGYGLFYRFLPADRTALHKGGRLQALGFRDNTDYGDSRNWDQEDWRVGQWRDTVWIDLEGVDNPDEALRARGHAKGAAWFARGEGVHYGQGELYFTCTSGGPGRLGQIMRYQPSRFEGDPGEKDEPGRLQLFVQPGDKRVMQMCDNLAVAPWGHLMVCEDKAEPNGVNYLKGITPAGKVYAMGRQAQPGKSDVGANTELAGVCFSPDGTTLFVNAYWPGMTLAITGPWGRFRA